MSVDERLSGAILMVINGVLEYFWGLELEGVVLSHYVEYFMV